jgi:hypothetical protein
MIDGSDDLLISYIMGVGSAEWPHAYQDVELLPRDGPLLDSVTELDAESYPFLDLVSTVSCRLIYDLGEAGLIKTLISGFGQGDYRVEVLTVSDLNPSATGWSNWISMPMEYPLFDGPLSYGGANPRQDLDPAVASLHQAIRDLESRAALVHSPSTTGVDFVLRRGLSDLLASDPKVDPQELAAWLNYESNCSRGCCPRGFDILDGGIARVLTHARAGWSLEQARVSLIDLLRVTTPGAWQDFGGWSLEGAWVTEFDYEDFRPQAGSAWSDVAENSQLAILEQLMSVSDEHPAWFPIALIARHPGSAQSVLRRAASSGARDVVEALLVNDNYSPMRDARELLKQAYAEEWEASALFAELIALDDPAVRRWAVRDPRCPPEVLTNLALHDDPLVQLTIATRSDAPAEALSELMVCTDRDLLRALAMNPNSPQAILKALVSREDPGLAFAVLANPGADLETRALAHLLVN